MQKMLKGKVAIITGAGSGIGFGIAKKFAENGCNVVLNVHRELKEYPGGANRVKDIEAFGVKCLVVKADVSDGKQVGNLVKKTTNLFGKVDIVVNNAALIPKEHVKDRRKLFDIPEEEWDRVLAVNLKGSFLLSKEVAPKMAEARSGRIINISAVSGISPLVNFAHYNASKAALNLLTKDMALELAPSGVTVNCICPGLIRTEMAEGSGPEGMEVDAYMDRFAKNAVPMQKPGYAEDIANAALFFASNLASYITGEVLSVAGGVPLMRSKLPE